MEQTKIDQLEVNGVKYVRADLNTSAVSTGTRCVIIVDRGWIFAGDVTEKNGRIYLSRAVHVQGWDGVGLDGALKDSKTKVRCKKLTTCVDIPADSEIFRCPVEDSWGL